MSYSMKRRRKPKQELSEEQKEEIKEAFDLFDTDKNQTIDAHEMKVAMRALGFDVTRDEILRLMDEMDRGSTGQISYNDFLQIMTQKMAERDPREEMNKAFNLFDHDGKGFITLPKLRKVAREIGESMTDDELQAMIDEFDRDQDKAISREEFIAIMINNDDFY